MKRALAHIYSDDCNCVNRGGARHSGAPSLNKPRHGLRPFGGQERGWSVLFTSIALRPLLRRSWCPSGRHVAANLLRSALWGASSLHRQ